MYLPQEAFFNYFTNDVYDSDEEYYKMILNNETLKNSILDILELFNFFYIRGTEANDIKISRKAVKLN